MAADTGGKQSRMQAKLTAALDDGQYYEAHQLYRTFYYRLVAQAKYAEVLDLLYNGAVGFFDKNQTAIGVDLSELFAETLVKSSWPVTDERMLDRVQELFGRSPSSSPAPNNVHLFGTPLMAESSHRSAAKVSSSDSPAEKKRVDINEAASLAIERNKLFGTLLAWSKSVSTERRGADRGDSRLHKRLATVYWHEKRYENARYHFLLSTDSEGTALFLIEYHTTRGYANEVDLFVTQCVFQYLCHSNKTTASSVFYMYTAQHPQIQQAEPPYKLPLLNFVWLLLLCIELKQVTYYSILVEKYQASLKRDPSYHSYLDKIGQIFFGLPAPVKKRPGGGGFLNNILQSLMGGGSPSDAPPPAAATGSGGGSQAHAATPEDDDFHSVTSEPAEMIDMEHEELD